MNDFDNIQIECVCASEFFDMRVDATWDEDVEVLYIGTYLSAFMTAQDSWWSRFTKRLRWAWAILRGKDFWVEEIVITDAEDVARLGLWLATVSGRMRASKKYHQMGGGVIGEQIKQDQKDWKDGLIGG